MQRKHYIVAVMALTVLSLICIYHFISNDGQHTESNQTSERSDAAISINGSPDKADSKTHNSSQQLSVLKTAIKNLRKTKTDEMGEVISSKAPYSEAFSHYTEEQLTISREADSRYFDVMPEKLDREWAKAKPNKPLTDTAADQIQTLMSEHAPDTTTFETVDCRGELCKAIFKTEDRTTLEDFKVQWKAHGPDNRQNMGNWSEDGDKLKVTVFFVEEDGNNVFADLRKEIHQEVKNELYPE